MNKPDPDHEHESGENPVKGLRQENQPAERGLADDQREWGRELAVDIIALILQYEAPEPTSITNYEDIHGLTQVPSFAEWQERILSAPTSALHPGHRVFAAVLQLINSDHMIQAVQGYLYRTRRLISHALENVKGVQAAALKACGGSAVTGKDAHGREWQTYSTSLTPDSVAVRQINTNTPKRGKKRARKRKPARRRGKLPGPSPSSRSSRRPRR